MRQKYRQFFKQILLQTADNSLNHRHIPRHKICRGLKTLHFVNHGAYFKSTSAFYPQLVKAFLVTNL